MSNDQGSMTKELAIPMRRMLLLVGPSPGKKTSLSANRSFGDSQAICHLALVLPFGGFPLNW